jgi:Cof subfamily protein (haloacid dehalogenase superfamily)
VSRAVPKLIAVDLDGTLLDAQGNPHERDLRALRALVERGTHVSILTGRLYSGTRPSVLAVGLKGPVGCVDGSHMVSGATHTTLMHHGISGQHATLLRDVFARTGPATFVFARDAIVYDESGDPYLGYVATWSNDVRRSERIIEHDVWLEAEGLTAVVAVGNADQIATAVEGIQDDLADVAQVAMFPIRRILGAWGLVVRAVGGNKGTALEWLAKHYGIGIEETICVGDWQNDVPMFMKAGRSFAMGQAPDDVKATATDVLEETSELGGGIARVVEECFGVRV